MTDRLEALVRARRSLGDRPLPLRPAEAEGGCGVVGLAASIPVLGRHILAPCAQMHNRGNGKGGGLTAAGLLPEQLGVDARTLAADYVIQIALLDGSARADVERDFLRDLDVHEGYRIATLDDYRDVELDIRPPDVWRYFGRVRPDVLDRFIRERGLQPLDRGEAEDEFLSQWAFRLNRDLYADGKMRAFVVSSGRDMLVLKVVGYAEQAFRYYNMEELQARVWIGHQRYPTKGRVWHPGGAHPFAALDVALVHNGDFANYHAVGEYLAQRGLYPLFLTDTEVAVLLFDLWGRTYRYPLEYLLEALAPTTERDFLMLPPERQTLYRAIQAAHLHASPDGPWFFIVARTVKGGESWQLIGITDTSMLRPQVFSLQEGAVQIGIIASEKQAIDATLRSLSQEDPRVCPVADRYWNARGGSYTDGGAFIYTVEQADSIARLTCTNKFGETVATPPGQLSYLPTIKVTPRTVTLAGPVKPAEGGSEVPDAAAARREMARWSYDDLLGWLDAVERYAALGPGALRQSVDQVTTLLGGRYPTGRKKRASVRALLQERLFTILRSPPEDWPDIRLLDWTSRRALRADDPDALLLIDAVGFAAEGAEGLSQFLVNAYQRGWRRMLVFDVRGQRFIGNGFGPRTERVRLDVYGSPGDYLGSGLDGMTLVVHASGQDQCGQILKGGTLVFHGDVGQTFLYGAKGGEIFVLGNAAGRPLINAVGRPRVVINGSALDYLAESFMAGIPTDGGGFCVLNGVMFDVDGRVIDQATPYPGSNLFSLASGGAIYARDPFGRLDEHQLNGGRYAELTDEDWALIRPYLEENERLFGIPLEALLTVDGRRRPPHDVYRKVEPRELAVLK